MEQIYSYSYSQLVDYCLSIGWKKFQAEQIFKWLYRKRVTSFDEMTDLSLEKREYLKEHFVLNTAQLKVRQVSSDGTRKYLLEMQDGSYVECVLMLFDYGKTVCVSSQVGCNMGCSFCASGLLKKQRDLTSGEMVEEVLFVQRELDAEGERVSHIVIMGTGEPFDNFENVMNFTYTVNHDLGLAIGARHITISTCGLAPKIREFADRNVQYNLAISLHAPNDELRSKLMPVNKAYPLEELFAAVDYYITKSNRRLTFEYILLEGVNDTDECVKQLADLLRGYNAYVNLIPYNKVDEKGYRQVDYKKAMGFYDKLMKQRIQCTLRQERGSDIDAACGQLRAKQEKQR
ncbi:MAG: 23S rRNA (adenine(2503)-C(2))-methyltransferase RlmN [Erysipelotrichaceae bacterium]|nr:23S rRNA (adenine(2503)-C(2))-methyltransferase RlmN [Erysipelotrichaceae bacterium]